MIPRSAYARDARIPSLASAAPVLCDLFDSVCFSAGTISKAKIPLVSFAFRLSATIVGLLQLSQVGSPFRREVLGEMFSLLVHNGETHAGNTEGIV